MEDINYNDKKYVYDKVLTGIDLGNKENHFNNPNVEEVSIQDVIRFLQSKLIND